MTTSSNQESTSKTPLTDMTPLFSGEGDETGELFRDKVRAIFEKFDQDKDGHLKFDELAALQKATADTILTEEMFLMACRALDCKPGMGISLPALKLTYASQGSNIEKDYYKAFPELKPKDEDDSDKVYEVGDDGAIDISS